jgi:Polysaccharide lyase
VQASVKHLAALLLAAFLAVSVFAGAASASPPRAQQTTGTASKASSKRDERSRHRRAKGRPAVAGGQAIRRNSRRLVRVRHRRSQRHAASVKDGVALTSKKVSKKVAENPEVLFRGDFDEGFTAWHVQSLGERATLFSTGAFQGTDAARFEVRDGDVEPETGSQRSEVSGPTFDEGQDLYIRDAIRIPAANTYDVPWQIIQQLHEEDWGGSPGMAVMLDNEHALKLGSGDDSHTFWQGPSLQADRWYDLVYRVNLSQDPGAGFVEVWLDGVQQSLANGQTRIYGQTIQAAQTYLKAGIYRSKSSTGTSIVEHDAIVVGTSYAAVTAG